MMGASNTVGMGASLSFEDRIKLYLEENSIDAPMPIGKRKVFVSFDYFFPTNFSELNDLSKDHLSIANEVVRGWAKDYDEVFVMRLPHYSDAMSDRVRKNFNKVPDHAPIKNILEALGTSEISNRVVNLNNLLEEVGEELPNVHVISFEPFYQHIHDYLSNRRKQARHGRRAGRAYYHNPKVYFKDPLHINDLGQAKFFNILFREPLNKQLKINLPAMKEAALSEEVVRSYIRKKLCSKDTFMEVDKCHYWVGLSDKSQFSLKKAKLHLPASLAGNNQKQIVNASKESKIWDLINEIDDDAQREATLNIMAIAEIIDKNAKGADSGLMINLVNQKSKLYLDLSKVLFFTTFPTFKIEDGSDQYVNWGYDHWLSYKYFYNSLQYSGMYTQKNQFERMAAPAPGTNYKISVNVDKSTGRLSLNWRIYATIPGQKNEQSRLEYIPEPHYTNLTADPEAFPYVEYKLEFELEDLAD